MAVEIKGFLFSNLKALLSFLIFSNLSYSQTRKLPAPGPETIKNQYAQLAGEAEKATSDNTTRLIHLPKPFRSKGKK
jgi:hypothetical protein